MAEAEGAVTHQPQEQLYNGGWRTDPTGNDSLTIRKHPWLQRQRQRAPNCPSCSMLDVSSFHCLHFYLLSFSVQSLAYSLDAQICLVCSGQPKC